MLFARQFLLGTCTDFYSGIRNNYIENNVVQLLNSNEFTNRNENLVLKCQDCNFGESSIVILNIDGKLLQTIQIQSDFQELELGDLTSGVYFLQLRTKNEFYRFKILKN